MRTLHLLFVDDDEEFLRAISTRLTLRNIHVAAFGNGAEALAAAGKDAFDVAVLDLKMPGMNGEDLLQRLKNGQPLLEVIILTGHGSIRSAVECTRTGAYDYLQKPCDFETLLHNIAGAFAKRLKSENAQDASLVDGIVSQFEDSGSLELIKELQKINRSYNRE